jgi:hypothetical protein
MDGWNIYGSTKFLLVPKRIDEGVMYIFQVSAVHSTIVLRPEVLRKGKDSDRVTGDSE